MIKLEHKTLLDAGVHFGHLAKKWNPKMAPFIFMKQNGIHIIDLNKTITSMEEAAWQLSGMARLGKKILFVATKKQIKGSVERVAKELGMPYVTERWLGGTLTNFLTIRKLLKRMSSIDKTMQSVAYKSLAKKEQLVIFREQVKLNKVLSGLSNVTRLPSALFVIDINKERIAVREAQKLGIPVFALADTNVDPDLVDCLIPGNDDSFRSVDLVVSYLADAIKDGIEIYKKEKVQVSSKETTGENTVGVVGGKVVKKGLQVVQGVLIKKDLQTPSKFRPAILRDKEKKYKIADATLTDTSVLSEKKTTPLLKKKYADKSSGFQNKMKKKVEVAPSAIKEKKLDT